MPRADNERIIVSCQFIWQGIEIKVEYEPDWLGSRALGYTMAHFDIYAIEPEAALLPITETGYRSQFVDPTDVDAAGGPEAFIRAWLDHDAKSSAWAQTLAEHRQLSLF